MEANNLVPFPSIARFNDEPENSTNFERPTVHGRVHSTESIQKWQSPFPSHTANRSRIGPLDLASLPSSPTFSSFPTTPTRKHSTQFASPTRVHRGSLVLTPPLTPSSSLKSDRSDGEERTTSTPGTSEPGSPMKTLSGMGGWKASTSSPRLVFGDIKLGSAPTQAGYLTPPSSVRSRSFESQDDAGDSEGAGIILRKFGSLDIGASPVDEEREDENDETPKFEKVWSSVESGMQRYMGGCYVKRVDGVDIEFGRSIEEDTTLSRYVALHPIPPQIDDQVLRSRLLEVSDVEGFFVIYKETHGVVIVKFQDVRDAATAMGSVARSNPNDHGVLKGKTLGQVFGACEDWIGKGSKWSQKDHHSAMQEMERLVLNVGFVGRNDARRLMKVPPPLRTDDLSFFIRAKGQYIPLDDLKRYMETKGPVHRFEEVNAGESCSNQLFYIEYCDNRDASEAIKSFNGRRFFKAQLELENGYLPPKNEDRRAPQEIDLTSPRKGSMALSEEPLIRVRPRSVSAGESAFGASAFKKAKVAPQSASNDLFFDGSESKLPQSPIPSRRRSTSMEAKKPDCKSIETGGPSEWHAIAESSLGLSSSPTMPAGSSYAYHSPAAESLPTPPPPPTYHEQHLGPPTDLGPQLHRVPGLSVVVPSYENGYHLFAPPAGFIPSPNVVLDGFTPTPFRSPIEGIGYTAPLPPWMTTSPALGDYRSPLHPPGLVSPAQMHAPHTYPQVAVPRFGSVDESPPSPSTCLATTSASFSNPRGLQRSSSRSQYAPTSPSSDRRHEGSGGGGSEKNQPIDIAKIENGIDMRTTVMIKNIPNKMSDGDLMEFINRVCNRRYDFLYLRMDFSNGCNVGYAFVNFITVEDLLLFAKTMLGVKWNMYSSEKVLQMSYATYQGKEALVEKFKNSCIMDEPEPWRPKIFFSEGPDAGLPEPFPPPTHLRRKERSAHNRGALFVPGPQHNRGGGGGTTNGVWRKGGHGRVDRNVGERGWGKGLGVGLN
ncbi:hypothetical protein ABKN59_009286 [Abortiporus biennis]